MKPLKIIFLSALTFTLSSMTTYAQSSSSSLEEKVGQLGINSIARTICNDTLDSNNVRQGRRVCKGYTQHILGEVFDVLGLPHKDTLGLDGALSLGAYDPYLDGQGNMSYPRLKRGERDNRVIYYDLNRCGSAGSDFADDFYGVQRPDYCHTGVMPQVRLSQTGRDVVARMKEMGITADDLRKKSPKP